MNDLLQLDESLFLLLNSLQAEWLNPIMLFVSRRFVWIPFYLLLSYFIFKKYDFKQTALIVLIAGITILLSDQGSVHLFKKIFLRLRPCHQEQIIPFISLLKDCGGQYGFISSHAANTFALATLVGKLLSFRWQIILFTWAALVSYSRVYIGVHFPGDILAGALFGLIVGSFTLMMTKRYLFKH
jgi:undecaprenyl-diphosphatase